MFDKRYVIFEVTCNFLENVISEGGVKYDDLYNFKISISSAEFLFDDDINNYLKNIYNYGHQYMLDENIHQSEQVNIDEDNIKIIIGVIH